MIAQSDLITVMAYRLDNLNVMVNAWERNNVSIFSEILEIVVCILFAFVCLRGGWWQKYNRTIAKTKVENAEIDKKKAVAGALKPYLDAEKRGR